MIITKKKKFLFVHIPRCAGKSIVTALKDKYGTRKMAWEHARIKDARFNIKGYTKFCVVRNPWERMVSMWSFLCQFKPVYENRHNKRRKWDELRGNSFEWWLIHQGKRSHNLITSDIPQMSWMVKNGRFVMDHVIRFENLAEDFSDITGLPTDVLPVTHKTKHKTYQEYYTKDSREYVERVFASDIKKWGYTFE